MANFLDNDHLVSLDSIVKVLNAEIQWCYQHSDGANGTFRGPFISGLEQAKYLIIKMAEAGDCAAVLALMDKTQAGANMTPPVGYGE